MKREGKSTVVEFLLYLNTSCNVNHFSVVGVIWYVLPYGVDEIRMLSSLIVNVLAYLEVELKTIMHACLPVASKHISAYFFVS